MSKRKGIEVESTEQESKLKTIFCGYNPVGDFAELCCKGADIDIEVEKGRRFPPAQEEGCYYKEQ